MRDMKGGGVSGRRALLFIYGPPDFEAALQLSLALRTRLGVTPLVFCPSWLPDLQRMSERAGELGICFFSARTPGGEHDDPLANLAAGFPELGTSVKPPLRTSTRLGRLVSRLLTVPTLHGETWSYLTTGHYSTPFVPDSRPPAKHDLRRRLPRRLYCLAVAWALRWTGVVSAKDIGYWINMYMFELDAAERVLDALNPVVGIFPEENIDYNTAVWTAALRHRGIPSACISNALPARSEVASVYFDEPDRRVQGRRWLVWPWLRRWVHRHAGRSLIRYPPERALGMELLGLAPRRPWVLNTGFSDRVVVESRFLRDRFAALGIDQPGDRVRVAGHPVFDRLHATLVDRDRRREALRREFGLSGDRPIAVCSLPTNQYYIWRPPEFPTYDELLAFWAESLKCLNSYDCFVSPHPSIPKTALEPLEGLGARVVSTRAADLIPLADLFICPVSTTGKWARACGLPVINYNTYRFRYEKSERAAYLDGLPGIFTVNTASDYLALLERFDNLDFLREATGVAARDASYWGEIDGRSMERILALVLQLIEEG